MNAEQSIEAYPLHWPPHRKRTAPGRRSRANFHRWGTAVYGNNTYKQKKALTIADSRDRLHRELELLGCRAIVISSNLKLRQDGEPMSAQREPDDVGIAVYFKLNTQPHCLACDTWDRCADNLAAIAKYVEAMRGQIRWGVGDVATLFAGFKQLPGAILVPVVMTPLEAAIWLAGLGCTAEGLTGGILMANHDLVEQAYRDSVKQMHPDSNSGIAHPDWQKLQDAMAVLRLHHQDRR